MFKKKNDGNGEKIFRYSIRKYHFGAASVAVAALMFFANGVQAQAPAVSSATASDVVAGSAGTPDKDKQESDGEEPEKVSQTEPSAELQSTGESNSSETKTEDASKGQETAGLAPTKLETKPAAQETSQGGAVKEQDQPTSATKTTEAKSLQGTLQTLLANLTLDSMKTLHDEVEARLAAAKAVLDDPNATQAQVDEQVRAMEELTRRVNQALEPSLPKLTDLGEAGSTNNKLSAPDGAATEQATGGKRRKRGNLSQATPAVDQVSPEAVGSSEKTEPSEKPSRQELPTYTNTTEGENGVYGLKDELESIVKRLKENQASEDKIQAAKAAADKFNEAFSKGDTISQEDFAAALVDLKKSRDLIEGVLEEKYGEETTAGGVTPQPRDGGYSDFRSSRVTRATRAGENYSEDFTTARESYFERTDIKGHSPYDKYTYVFFSDRRPRDNSTAYIKDGYKYLNVTVEPTNNGFRWTIEINKDNHRTFPGHTEVWFTVPSGQTVKTNTVGISYHDRGGGTHAPAQDGRDLVEKLKNANIGLGDVTKGTISNSGLPRRFGPTVFPRNNLEDLARGRRYDANPYERQAESQEAQAISNEKLENIKKDANASLYYFQLPNSDRSYKLTFETEGNRDLGKLDYAAGLRGQDGREVFLVNQWHSRTTTEFKEDALKQIEQARKDKNSSITGNRNLSEVEQNGATATVNTYARRATDKINKAQNIGEVDNALNQGLRDIRQVNPVGRELAKTEVTNAKNAADRAIEGNNKLSEAEKTAAKASIKSKADDAISKIGQAQDQNGVDTAKTTGVTEINRLKDGQVGRELAKTEVTNAKNAADRAIEGNNKLSEAEKTAAKASIKSKADDAISKIGQAQDQNGVDTAKTTGVTEINRLKDGQVGRELAKTEVTNAKNAADRAIEGNNKLSEAEKTAAKASIKSKADDAISKIGQAQDQNGVDTAKTTGVTEINRLKDGQVGRELAKTEVTNAKNAADRAIEGNNKLSEAEKTAAKASIKSKADDAISKIGQAQDQNGVDTAKTEGLNALDKILKDLSNRINQGNSSTPDNSDNTPAPSVMTDDSSNTTPATSSSTVGQAQASTPAHSEDSTNQAAGPSVQQREVGNNSPTSSSSQGLSESSVTPPARSRRSVGFAGGTQSSQEKQVDKSVLRDLIQDLETRLKDLDGIDQSVIDAAKVILGEGQEALRNADLTEAGLREITAKIKEALESLKGKQATKDKEEMQETSKEQGHLPYGTMIGSLLALLGLLLFLIARRKKESELKKLTKELTKVLQESDLTSVDAKVLDQAREALAQAVAFLANEKESDHTEDELIEKLKVILAQLR